MKDELDGFWKNYFTLDYINKKQWVEDVVCTELIKISKLDSVDKTKKYIMAHFLIGYFDDLTEFLRRKK